MCITIVIYISCNTLIEYMKKYSDKRVCGTVNLEAEQSQIWFISKSRILKFSSFGQIVIEKFCKAYFTSIHK